jgi:phage-related baseplate assembly protein
MPGDPNTIDLSRFPPPEALRDLSYEAIVAERLDELVARYEAQEIVYDVERLETDPGVILQQEDAYRELLDKQGINDAIRAILPAFATGRNLEHIAARANVERAIITPTTTGSPAVYETDAQLLDRYLASFAAPAAGSEDGYIARAAKAWPARYDIRVLGPEWHGVRGRVQVILLAAGGSPVSAGTLQTVRDALNAKDARPLTDDVQVMPALVTPWSLTAHLVIRRGPDPAVVRAQAETSARAYALSRYFVGGEVPANAVSGSLYVPNVERVVMSSPLADLPGSASRAWWLSELTLTHEVLT